MCLNQSGVVDSLVKFNIYCQIICAVPTLGVTKYSHLGALGSSLFWHIKYLVELAMTLSGRFSHLNDGINIVDENKPLIFAGLLPACQV